MNPDFFKGTSVDRARRNDCFYFPLNGQALSVARV